MMPEPSRKMSQTLIEAVDEGLLLLGENSRKSIYFHLQNIASIKREDIPNNPQTFAEGLKIFGAGAKIIEEAIIKDLYSKLGLKFEKRNDSSFSDYIEKATRCAEGSTVQNFKLLV